MPMGIVVFSCVCPSVQPSMGLGLCIAYKALGRNGLQFGMLMYPDGLHSAFMDAYGYCCWSVCPSICLFVRLRHFQVAVHLQRRGVVIIGRWLLPSLVDTGDICCHYWQHILVFDDFSFFPKSFRELLHFFWDAVNGTREHCSFRQCALNLPRSFFFVYHTKDSPYLVYFVSANLTDIIEIVVMCTLSYNI